MEDHREKQWRHRKRDQREPPAQAEHDGHHTHQREAVHQHSQQSRGNKALNGVDVAGQSADQVAGLFLIVEAQGKALNVRVKRVPKVVHDPLAQVGGNVFLRVTAHRAHSGDHQHGQRGEFQNRDLVRAGGAEDQLVQPSVPVLRLQHVVQNHLERPWLRQRGQAFDEYRGDPDRQAFCVGPEQAPYGEPWRHWDHLGAKVLHCARSPLASPR